MNQKISVIVPVYNTSKYLKKCLDSLVKQTYKNIEIIVVDDGSTDDSGKICDQYALEFGDKLIVTHTKNQGLSAARNTGIRLATGVYIGFVDSDDWVELDMFEVVLKNMIETQSDVSVCGLKIDFDNGNSNVKRKYNREYYEKAFIFEQIIKNKDFYGYAWNKLFKKEFVEKIYFDEKLLSCEDLVFSVNYAKHCRCAVATEDELYHYRQHQGSMTGDLKYNVRKLSVIDAYEMIIPIYEMEKPELLYVLYRNYLKINLNVKGRMKLSKVIDSEVMSRLNHNINKYYTSVLNEKRNSLSVKMNVLFSKCFPGMMLRLKQFVIKMRYKGN